MTSTLDRDAGALRRRMAGHVFLPGDRGYDDARSVWNGEINLRPGVIARCGSAADVVAAIEFGRQRGLEIAVRGGAHNFGGAAVCEGGLMIHLGGLNEVAVDPEARLAHCGGGATMAELDAATQAHALAVPSGTISHTGVGGLTLGGGFGWLSRRHGMTIDNLRSAEVVTAEGQVLRASATEHPDLFWALRGGGGNFGVVTEFEYQLHPVGPIVQLGLFFWDLDRGTAALRLSRTMADTLPRSAGVMLAALNAPPAPFVPPEHHGVPGYALIIVGFGPPEEHAEWADRVRGEVPPTFEFVTPIPYVDVQKMLDDAAPWGVLGYEKALSMDALSDAAIDVIVERVPLKSSPMSIMPMFAVNGAIHDVSDDATAFGGRRETGIVVNIASIAPDPDLFAADRRWVRELWAALTPFAEDLGSYVNFLNDYQEGDRVLTAFGVEKYERLSRIKAKYDPDNVFHRNPNIKPAARTPVRA